MKTVGSLMVVTAMVLACDARADAFLRRNVIHYLQHAPVTAHVRIDGASTMEALRDPITGRIGYKRFKMTATVIEGFKGVKHGRIEFIVTQEQPSDPPRRGEFIVSLDRDQDGRLVFADDSVLWVTATQELLAAARVGK